MSAMSLGYIVLWTAIGFTAGLLWGLVIAYEAKSTDEEGANPAVALTATRKLG